MKHIEAIQYSIDKMPSAKTGADQPTSTEKDFVNFQQTALVDLRDTWLSVRALRILPASGINTVGELCQCSPSRLLSLPGFGNKSLCEVGQFLDINGLSLQEEPPPIE
jgi:DNA-directed RNA polymerase alpha subunit